MFTKNFYKLEANDFSNWQCIPFSVVRANGEVYTVNSISAAQNLGSKSLFGSNTVSNGRATMCEPKFLTKTTLETPSNQVFGVVFGSGTTPPTIDDYTMAGELLSKAVATVLMERTCDDEGVTWKASYTITNNEPEDFTISEVGLFANTTSSSTKGPFLIERTVLDSPVTIPAGGVGVVTYTIRMNYPTA